MSRRRLTVALAVLVALVFGAPARAVFAHATFLGSDPADGSVLQQAPDSIALRFSEEVLLGASTVTLLELGSGTETTLPLTATDGGATVIAELPEMAKGAYLVDFVVVDPADLHKTVGTISLGIGVAAAPSASSSAVDGSWLSLVARTVTGAALLVAVGGVLVLALATRRRLRVLEPVPAVFVAAAAVVAVGWVVLFVLDVASVGFAHARWGTLLIGSDPGRRALIGVQVALAVWWVSRLLPAADAASRWLLARILGALAGGLVLLAAYGGHGAVGGNAWLGWLLRAAHLGALSAWLGTVAVTWWAARRDREWATLWPPVSRMAAWGIGITGTTGFLLSGRVVDSVTALLSTTYGRAIVGKVAVLLLLGALGWLAGRRVARGGAPRVVGLEVGLAVVALALAAVLAGTAPAKGVQFEPLPVDEPQVVTNDAADLTVSASLQPARPGANLVTVRVLDTRRPPLGTVEGVTMTLTRADGEVVATRDGVPQKGEVSWPDVELVSPGEYEVSVAVDRPEVPVPEVTDRFLVAATPAARADTVLSDREWWPIALVSAAAWVLLVALGRWAVRRGRPADGSPDRRSAA